MSSAINSNKANQFLEYILHEDRLLHVAYDNIDDEIKFSSLYYNIISYTEKYINYNNIGVNKAVSVYIDFISEYIKHCKEFKKTKIYPAFNSNTLSSLNREEYDVVLLLSILFTPHRFKIMSLLQGVNKKNKGLFIGIGSGIELSLTKSNIQKIHSYDLSVSEFVYSEFPDIEVHSKLYEGQKQNYYDIIYMIELLEHIESPYQLIETCYNSLSENGLVVLTTATNVPQFDHVYNFLDHNEFENKILELGFSIKTKQMIKHEYTRIDVGACNHYYILEKRVN